MKSNHVVITQVDCSRSRAASGVKVTVATPNDHSVTESPMTEVGLFPQCRAKNLSREHKTGNIANFESFIRGPLSCNPLRRKHPDSFTLPLVLGRSLQGVRQGSYE